MVVDARAVLCSVVVTLSILLLGVDAGKKELAQVIKRDLGGVVCQLHCLCVTWQLGKRGVSILYKESSATRWVCACAWSDIPVVPVHTASYEGLSRWPCV